MSTIIGMKEWRLWPQVYLLAGALLAGGVCVSCTLSPMDTTELEAEALTSQIQPTAVTDLAATTTEKSTITFDFSGDPDEIAAGAYYTLYYLSGPDYSTIHTIPVVAQSVAGHYVFTLSDQSAGKHVLAWVVTNIPVVSSSGAKGLISSDASEIVEGATAPSVWLEPQVAGTNVTLRYGIDGLLSDMDESSETMLYSGYRVVVNATKSDETYTVYDSGVKTTYDAGDFEVVDATLAQSFDSSAAEVSYKVTAMLYDPEGKALLSSDLDSGSETITTDRTFLPMPITTISATSGAEAKKDSVVVSWTAPDYRSNIGDVAHRVKLERSDDDGLTWTAVVRKETDINDTSNTSFTQTALDSLGKTVYTFTDTTVSANTEYLYRVTAAYIVNGKVYYEQDSSSSIAVTAEPGYTIFLPTDLTVTNSGTYTATSRDATVEANLSWFYDWHSQSGLPDGCFFVVYCDDGHGAQLLDDVTITQTTGGVSAVARIATGPNFSSTFNSRTKHTWTFSVGVQYSDGTVSSLRQSDDALGYSPDWFVAVDYVTGNLSATTSLASSVKLSWQTRLSTSDPSKIYYGGDKTNPSLDAANLSYTIRWGENTESITVGWNDSTSVSSTVTVGDATIPYTVTRTDDTETGISTFNAMISISGLDSTAFYVEATYATEESDPYNGTTTLVSTNGSTLLAPSFIASDGASLADITLTFDSAWEGSRDFSGYRVYVKDKDDSSSVETAYPTSGNIPKETADYSVSTLLGTTPVAGHTYEFQAVAVDSEGNETARSVAEDGNTLGPVLSAYAQNNAAKDNTPTSFAVTFKAMPGATSYEFILYKGTDTSVSPVGNITVDATDITSDGSCSYVFSYENDDQTLLFAKSTANPYPKSTDYTVKILATNDDAGITVDAGAVEGVTGGWFGPPAVVTASHGTAPYDIDVTWDAVTGADGYYVYKNIENNSDWGTPIETVTSGNSFTDSIDDLQFYAVEAYRVRDGVTQISAMSSTLDKDSNGIQVNYGYRFAPPDFIAVHPYDDREYYTVTWSARPDISTYRVYQDSAYVDVTSSSSGVSIDNQGRYVYQCSLEYETAAIARQTSHSVSVACVNKDGVVSTATSAQTGYRDLHHSEILKIVNYDIQSYMQTANSQFENDWWGQSEQFWDARPTARNYSNAYTNVRVDITSCSATLGQQNIINGSIIITANSSQDTGACYITTIEPVGMRAYDDHDVDNKPFHLGYQNVDPLKCIGVAPGQENENLMDGASFVLTYPYFAALANTRTATVTISQVIDVVNNTGKEIVTKSDGTQAEFDYSTLSQRMF